MPDTHTPRCPDCGRLHWPFVGCFLPDPPAVRPAGAGDQPAPPQIGKIPEGGGGRGIKPTRSSLPIAGRPFPTHHPYLAQIGGHWYIASGIYGYETPDLHINYYRVIRTGSDGYGWTPALKDGIPLEERSTATYAYKEGGSGWLYLTIDPQATAEYIDHYPIPCPKVRKGIPVRWHWRGYWEKQLKTGWVPA